MVTPLLQVYIGEVSSIKLRGIFGTLVSFLLTSGVLLNYGLGAIDNFPYYYISLVAIGIVALFEVLMIWLPETPRWLLSRGYGEAAEKVLLWLRGKKIGIQRELDDMKKAIAESKTKKTNVWREFRKRSVLVPLVYVLILFFYCQGGGIMAIAPFAAIIFSDAGVNDPRTTSIYAVGVSGIIGLVVSTITVDIVGRVVLLVISGTGMFLAASMLGIHFFITRPSLCDHFNSTVIESLEGISEPCNSQFELLAIVSVILFNFIFMMGWGTVPWVLLSELLPLSVRGVGSGLAMFTAWSIAAIFSGFYLPYSNLVRPWFAMWTIALIDLTSVVFVLIFIPETKGKTLEEMEKKYERKPDVVDTVL